MAKGQDKAASEKKISRRTQRNHVLRTNSLVLARYLLANQRGVPQEVLQAAQVVMPMRRSPGQGRVHVDNIAFFLEVFRKRKTLSEAEAYNEYGLTRTAMGTKRLSAIRQAKDPQDRVWIGFDKGKGVYRLLAQGANPPEGYEGPLPKDD